MGGYFESESVANFTGIYNNIENAEFAGRIDSRKADELRIALKSIFESYKKECARYQALAIEKRNAKKDEHLARLKEIAKESAALTAIIIQLNSPSASMGM